MVVAIAVTGCIPTWAFEDDHPSEPPPSPPRPPPDNPNVATPGDPPPCGADCFEVSFRGQLNLDCPQIGLNTGARFTGRYAYPRILTDQFPDDPQLAHYDSRTAPSDLRLIFETGLVIAPPVNDIEIGIVASNGTSDGIADFIAIDSYRSAASDPRVMSASMSLEFDAPSGDGVLSDGVPLVTPTLDRFTRTYVSLGLRIGSFPCTMAGEIDSVR